MKKCTVIFVLLALSFNLSAQPTTITWQGKLLDNNGNAITELSVPMNFAMYDASTGGNLLWPASGTVSKSVDVNQGLFTVQLGTGTGSDIAFTAQMFAGKTPWLEIVVNGSTLPRSPVNNVPFSVISNQSGVADNVAGGVAGSVPYQTGAGQTSLLAPGTAGQVLNMNAGATAPEWKTLLKSDVGLGNVENTALSTWTGTSSITTLGTIATGTWNGTTLGLAHGGTGATTKSGAFDALSPMTAAGDIIYGGTSGTGTKLVKGTAGQVLNMNAGANAPEWKTLSKSDVGLGNVENTALSTWAGTSNITTLGTISTGTWNGTTIALAYGGTGATTKSGAFDALSPMNSQGDIIFGGTSGTGTRLAKGTAGQVLKMNTSATAPEWSILQELPSDATSGDMVYFDGTIWKKVAAGQTGQILKFKNGMPTWVDDHIDHFSIGDYYQGGIIAYFLQPGDPGFDTEVRHGLIAAPSDQSGYPMWGCEGTTITGADGTALGTGAQNTLDILAGCTTAGIAAKICNDLVLNGYSDWFLPSIDELSKLYTNKAIIGGFNSNVVYWSSSEYNNDRANGLFFSDGTPSPAYKTSTLRLRAVRAF